MTDDVVVIVPALRRPHRVRPLLDSLAAATPEPHRTMFVATAGDRAMIAAILTAAEHEPIELEILPANRIGDYARKINHAYRQTLEPFLFAAADDLDFRPGWLPAALAPFTDPAIGVVGTQDLCNPRTIAGRHSTHLMFRRTYVDQHGTIDQPGAVFHEGYPHEFVDDEAVETAKFRGAWHFAADSIVEHLHPMNGKAPTDRLYALQAERMLAGRRVIRARRPLWTPAPARPSRSNVAIIVATFGEQRWADMARRRAVPSAEAEHPAELIVEHGSRLHLARNAGAARASAEWLCFLDADDELEPGYLDAMAATSGDLLAPAVRFVDDPRGIPRGEAVTFADRNISRLNPCVIGTLVRRQLFDEAGGFWPERAWEDWSLFRRCWLLGAKIEHVPRAVYRAHTDPAGRNSTVANREGLARQIVGSHALWLRRKRNQ